MKNKIILFFVVYFFLSPFLYAEKYAESFRFSGLDWVIKESGSLVGPGPNLFSGDSVKVNSKSVKLAITPAKNDWFCAEIYSRDYFRYGTFVLDFYLRRKLDTQAVFGFFLYNDLIPPYYNEIDFEAARWGEPENLPFSFSVQPYGKDGNSRAFDFPESGGYSCRIEWSPAEIVFSLTDVRGELIETWNYRGDFVPRETESRVHLNLWLYQGEEPLGDGSLDIRIRSFSYIKNN